MLKEKASYYIVFRYEKGGGGASRDFENLAAAMKCADHIYETTKSIAYYAIYENANIKSPYGNLAIFRGNQSEFEKTTVKLFKKKHFN